VEYWKYTNSAGKIHYASVGDDRRVQKWICHPGSDHHGSKFPILGKKVKSFVKLTDEEVVILRMEGVI
jgi:hypothetical protein